MLKQDQKKEHYSVFMAVCYKERAKYLYESIWNMLKDHTDYRRNDYNSTAELLYPQGIGGNKTSTGVC